MLAIPASAQIHNGQFLEKLLKKHSQHLTSVLDNPDKYEVQILYTKIDRNKRNEPHFTTYGYHVNNKQYFYPASTVKLPAVLLALEKVNKLKIDKNTPMLTGADRT